MPANSVLSVISQEFESLAESVLMEGSAFDMKGSLTLHEIKDLLLTRNTSTDMRDLIWRNIVSSVRSQNDAWATIALGMAMPGLSNLAKQFTRDYAEANHEDLCSEIVTGFLEALRTVDVERPAILTRVYWATYRAVRRSAYAEVFASKAASAAAAEADAVTESGHPDLVLARLVGEGVLSTSEADLISAVRMDRRSLSDVAEVLGTSVNAVLLRLRRAEMRVATRLTGTTACSRRAFKQGRKGGTGVGSDSFRQACRTSVVEEPSGILAAGGGSDEGHAR